MSEIVDFRDIDLIVKEGRLQDAFERLSNMIEELEGQGRDDVSEKLAEAYFRRGKIAWRQGRRAEAQSDYAHASALDPSSPAVVALEQARDVNAFFNHDLYNP